MVASNNITPGMTLSINGKLYRVESSIKVTVPKGTPFIKVKMRDLSTNDLVEKSFKLNQPVKDVSFIERRMEFLYLEGKDFLFLDIGNLEQVLVPAQIIGNNVSYLKEGVDLKASFYGDTIFAVELPQFLELMVTKIEEEDVRTSSQNATRVALLETGAQIEVPPFIEVGDIIKVDTKTSEYIQRV
ncbi:MAG: elongation factor P [Parachlamydiaceae bacterium]|nr:elongation factor P [Parachlamydiaceae bacterium]